MLYGFFGRVSAAPNLRESLDLSAQRTRGIAQRVSTASLGGQTGFALPNGDNAAALGEPPVNLEAEMSSLADETLRYETTAKLLEKTYQKIRLSMRDR